MVNFQQWVESQEEYNTKEKRANVRAIYLTEPMLEGKLDLREFTCKYLKVIIYPEVDSSKLTISNYPKYVQIIKLADLVNAQEYLDKEYPLAERNSITKLDISSKGLTGSLTITNFLSLEELNCSNNNLTTLTINEQEYLEELSCWNNDLTTLTVTNNPRLTELSCPICLLSTLTLINNPLLAKLECANNQLTNLDFLTTGNNENSLTVLSIWDNNLTGDLGALAPIFNKFTKLELLSLSNNNLTGSLQSLQQLSKLTTLYIENTNLTTGLEYLPESLGIILCQGTNLETKLQNYKNYKIKGDKEENYYNYQAWREDLKSLFELERISNVQKDIRRFFGSWGKEEIKKLKNPEHLGKWGYAITVGQWTGRATSAVGGSLVILGAGDYKNNYTIQGGILAILGPSVETFASVCEKKYYEKNETKWERFVEDSKYLWNDYHDLFETLKPFESCDESTKHLPQDENEWKQLLKDNPKLWINKNIWLLWEKIKLFKQDKNEFTSLTKQQLANDLLKNWESREELSNSLLTWKEIGSLLMKIGKEKHKLTSNKENNEVVNSHEQTKNSFNQSKGKGKEENRELQEIKRRKSYQIILVDNENNEEIAQMEIPIQQSYSQK